VAERAAAASSLLLPAPRPAEDLADEVSRDAGTAAARELERRRRLGLAVRRAHLARRREVLLHLTRA